MYDGINMTGVDTQNPALTWEFVDRLRKATPVKLLIKGIDTREDARLCVEHGIDGMLVWAQRGRLVPGRPGESRMRLAAITSGPLDPA